MGWREYEFFLQKFIKQWCLVIRVAMLGGVLIIVRETFACDLLHRAAMCPST
jgi:hypothetical protein